MKKCALSCIFAALHLAATAEVTMTRSMEVERLSATNFKVVCQIRYRGIDSTATYETVLLAGGTDMTEASPQGGVVSPSNPQITFTDNYGGLFVGTLGNGQLFIQRTFTHNAQTLPSYQFHQRYCQGGAVNTNTWEHLPAVLMYDQQR